MSIAGRSSTVKRRYILAVAAPALAQPGQVPVTDLGLLLEQLKADPNVTIIRTGGIGGLLERLIVEMAPEKAAALKEKFQGGLIVEQDEALHEPEVPFTS
jgi:tripartite-type tricarboxylate transporter receptor subunit TctC